MPIAPAGPGWHSFHATKTPPQPGAPPLPTTFRAPISDIRHALMRVAGWRDTEGLAEPLLTEAGRFAAEVMLPLDAPGDRAGVRLGPEGVRTAPGWKDAYRRWVEAGWNGLAAPPASGGQGLGRVLQAATAEIWSAANLSFGLCPLLTASAIEATRITGAGTPPTRP